MHERDGLGAHALGLAGQSVQVQARPQLHRELGPLRAHSVHDLAHEEAELPGADDEHAIARLDDGERSGFQRGAAGAREENHLVAGLEDIAQRHRGRLEHPSSNERSYWIEGGWFMAWMTGHGSSVGPGIIKMGRVCTCVQFGVALT